MTFQALPVSGSVPMAGFAEQRVPFLVSKPLAHRWCCAHVPLRNYDIFDAILNGVRT